MAIEERDPHTGYMTTGHEWNDIKELNRPIPKVVWVFVFVTHLFALVYWVLMPAWPLVETYTKGILGADQRTRVAQDIRDAAAARAVWTGKIATSDYKAIQADPSLMRIVHSSGRPLFEDNCAVCHGMKGQGGNGFPRLVDDAWLWSASPAGVAETIRVGINSSHPETRVSQMPAFGRDQILDRKAILEVVAYVRALSDPTLARDDQAPMVAAGRAVFAANCVACHGKDGVGNREIGASNLTDGFWIYGGDLQNIFTSVGQGRQGHMPHWEDRLSVIERKILALYVLDLGAAKK
ncbi:MAG: cytochrome-c oxidase, cbb3-type subunit III [Alphaproteobacteria bacterium]